MNELLDLVGNLQDCAWNRWTPSTLRFCEAHLCERIVAPAETWSNLAYLFVAVWLLGSSLKENRRLLLGDVRARLGIYAFIVGTASALFHASYTYVFETADLAAMNFLGVEMLIQGLKKVGWLKGQSPIVLSVLFFTTALLFLFGTVGSDRLAVFSGFVAIMLWLETLGYVRGRRLGQQGDYRALFATLALFVPAMAFWILDYTGLVCVPERHWFSGHAAWHVLNAGCFLTLSRFYRTR